jgi:hypothetical protein
VQRQLDLVFRAIPPALQSDAIVIVQGDHGSRIMQLEPTVASRATRDDYIDNFSTLFAIKSPWLGPGYDRRMASITCLMGMLGRSGFRSLDGLDECTGPPSVFAYDESRPHAADGDRSVVSRALMTFGEPPDEVVADGSSRRGRLPVSPASHATSDRRLAVAKRNAGAREHAAACRGPTVKEPPNGQ